MVSADRVVICLVKDAKSRDKNLPVATAGYSQSPLCYWVQGVGVHYLAAGNALLFS
jgi:hypothetical protein